MVHNSHLRVSNRFCQPTQSPILIHRPHSQPPNLILIRTGFGIHMFGRSLGTHYHQSLRNLFFRAESQCCLHVILSNEKEITPRRHKRHLQIVISTTRKPRNVKEGPRAPKSHKHFTSGAIALMPPTSW